MAWNPTGNLRGPAGPAGGAGDVAALIHAATVKATPVDADELPLVDSGSSWGLKKFTWANLKAALQTAFQAVFFHRGNILGTVTQSGGVPTGAVMQYGSNANGEFIRYADGTQIAWRVFNMPSSQTVAGESYWNGASWNFPAAFTAVPVISLNCFGSNGGYFVATFSYLTAAIGGDIFIMNTKSTPTAFAGQIHQLAVGRWF